MKIIAVIPIAALLFFVISCGEAFLDVKSQQRQRVPHSVEDFLGLMDNRDMMNRFSAHALGIIGADEFFISDEQYNVFPFGPAHNYQKNAYLWDDVIYEGGEPQAVDWTRAYTRILWANMTLHGVQEIDARDESELWKVAKGNALFHRALNYYTLAQLYAPAYSASAQLDAGLPLRMGIDLTVSVPRASLEETYDLIITDLNNSIPILPELSVVPYRPSKWAAYALLARVYLQMNEYELANHFANQCLAIKRELLDFNNLNFELPYTFPLNSENNPEVILNTILGDDIVATRLYYNPDTILLESYQEGDLRKSAYFQYNANGQVEFKGSYDGSRFYFTGLAVDEVYLIKAETDARLDHLDEALLTLNELRKHRFDKNIYIPYQSVEREEILDWVLAERRIELVMRGTRWEDLRRLNKEDRFAKKLSRFINGQYYELMPNSSKYTWPIPLEAITIGGYEQNDR